jgi:hypothetical protein
MGKKFIITIEVDPDAQVIVVRDEAGKEHPVKSVTVFGGDAENGVVYLFGWGASADAAWAYKEGFLYAEECGDASYRSFFKQCACHIAQAVDPDAFRRKIEAGEVLTRWESEDRDKGKWH